MGIKATSSTLLPICAAAVTVFGTVLTAGPAQADGGCVKGDVAGQVPRNARDGDMVCVPPDIAALVQQENANKDSGYAGGGPYGPLTCINGLVWREAFDGDAVCVTPARRTETWQENANAGVGATGGLKPNNAGGGGGGGGGNSSGGPDPALLAAVNDARAHPQKYPPNGNTAGAKMDGCDNPLGNSSGLANLAAAHNTYIATLPKSEKDLHKDPGGYAWDGRIQAVGFGKAGEIVAVGYSNAQAAVVDWMQNDGDQGWGHRNNILDCDYSSAGAAHATGGAWGNYWTVDLGG
jgi:hypothetical protein